LVAAAAAESDDVAALLDEQRCLEDRRAALAAALPPLRAEREGLEHHITALRAATVALDAWLGENAARVPEGLSADDALQGEDAWARQALNAAAEDAGVEDTLYVLAQGLEAGVVPVDQYLKLVRGLCREQFFARATVLVVQAARRERRGS
jgi:ESCRT-I complex subunit TSG101